MQYFNLGGGTGIRIATLSVPSYDPDAQLFFDAQVAAGVTLSVTEMDATNQLVLDMKTANVWTKMKAVYPFVGGTATSHKWNLVNPVDSNAAYRLVFNGGWTHSVTGALPNGTNGYADTFFNTDDVVSTGLQSFGLYLRTNPTFAVDTVEIPTGLRNGIYWIRMSNTSPTDTNLRSGTVNSNINGATGFIAQSRSTTTLWYGINNSTITNLPTTTSTLSNETTRTFLIGAHRNASVISSYSTQELAFSFYGEPLLTTEMSNFYTAIQTFQTTLSRNV
jgi:hypothetical protein